MPEISNISGVTCKSLKHSCMESVFIKLLCPIEQCRLSFKVWHFHMALFNYCHIMTPHAQRIGSLWENRHCSITGYLFYWCSDISQSITGIFGNVAHYTQERVSL